MLKSRTWRYDHNWENWY